VIVLAPKEEYDSKGCEDPRITEINGTYYLTYTAWDGRNARVALAVSKDMENFERVGIISPNIPVGKAVELTKSERYKSMFRKQIEGHGKDSIVWDKDCAIFPYLFDGEFVMLHRIEPDIQMVRFSSFGDLQDDKFWEEYIRDIDHYVLMQPAHSWESEKIGAGATPVMTSDGWLLLYHGVNRQNKHAIYSAGSALLDPEHPEKVKARSKYPLFSPEFEWERSGMVNNVVFPEGVEIEGDQIRAYYGCADKRIGLAELSYKELKDNLENI